MIKIWVAFFKMPAISLLTEGYFPRLRERLPPERRYIVPEVVDDSIYFETNYEPRYAASPGCCCKHR